MKRAAFAILVPCVMTAGCASAPLAPEPARRVGELPPLNEAVEHSVGDAVYETYNYLQIDGAKLSEGAMVDVLAASWSLPVNELLQAVQDAEVGKIYCTRGPTLRVMNQAPSSRVCLADRNGDGRLEGWKAPEGPPARRKWGKLKPEVGYVAGGDLTATMGGFRYELLYQGVSGNVLRLLYREYIDDLARPAFQQDLTYTLAENGPTEVSFRGLRLRVHSADNNTIRYERLSGLVRR